MVKRGNEFGRMALALALSATMILAGCSTSWIEEAEQIVSALIPAAANIVALVAALQGKTVSAADLQTIQNAGSQAGADLQLIQSLIVAYEKADSAAKPGILNQIQSAINAVQGNLQGLLPALHIKDAATQTKITAVVGILLSEVESLAAVVPLVSGQGQAAALRAADSPFGSAQGGRGRLSPHASVPNASQSKAPLSASEFVKSFNSMLTAKTGNAELDRATSGLEIHLHGKASRWASAGLLK